MPVMLDIRVESAGWGDADIRDIAAVLTSAGETLARFFPDRPIPPIQVWRGFDVPITHFACGPSGEIRVDLNVEGLYWSQLAFQFGHEMCHIVSGYADYMNPNRWFEETLCEVASLFVLGQMAEEWETRAPYPHWKNYSAALLRYRVDRIAEEGLADGEALRVLFGEQEPSLRADPVQRSLNLRMATAILPNFEAGPEHWEALSHLNAVRGDETRSFADYLSDWLRASPQNHREFIREIAELFGVSTIF